MLYEYVAANRDELGRCCPATLASEPDRPSPAVVRGSRPLGARVA